MKKVIAAVAATTAVFGMVQAHAQAKNFEGFSVGANVQLDTAVSNTGTGTDSGTSTTLGLQGRYDWALGNKFVLGLGLSADTGNHAAGSYASGAGAYTNQRYSLDLMPGYAVNNRTVVYGKLSTLRASAASDSGSDSAGVQGVGYGVGLRSMVDKKVYVQAAYDTYRYNDVNFNTGSSVGLKGNVLSLGVGYQF